MTDFTPFHQVIRERIISPGAKYYADPWWDAEIKQFTIDMNASIRFIDEEITDEELYWLGEVFEDIMEKTQSEAFLNCLLTVAAFPHTLFHSGNGSMDVDNRDLTRKLLLQLFYAVNIRDGE